MPMLPDSSGIPANTGRSSAGQGSAADPSATPVTEPASEASQASSPHSSPRAKDVPQPIGPERLRALRDAIRSGQYPSQDDVRTGLVRMFRPDAPVEAGEAES